MTSQRKASPMFSDANEPASSLSQSRKRSLTDWAHEWMTILFTPVSKCLQRLNISPNAITVLGLIFGLGGGVALATGYWKVAAGLIIVSGFMDGIDGLLARQSQKITPFGAFLDSVLDRWSDSAIFLGLVIWYSRMGMQPQVILAGVALASSLLVSYTRARAEGIGAQCKRGWFTRLERIITLVAGLILNLMNVALWVLAVLSTFTAIQRIYYTARYVQTHLKE
jgi:CDP-diacylglycerol--glycerol-3-phosphate 3-phosphatidyltransferase